MTSTIAAAIKQRNDAEERVKADSKKQGGCIEPKPEENTR